MSLALELCCLDPIKRHSTLAWFSQMKLSVSLLFRKPQTLYEIDISEISVSMIQRAFFSAKDSPLWPKNWCVKKALPSFQMSPSWAIEWSARGGKVKLELANSSLSGQIGPWGQIIFCSHHHNHPSASSSVSSLTASTPFSRHPGSECQTSYVRVDIKTLPKA